MKRVKRKAAPKRSYFKISPKKSKVLVRPQGFAPMWSRKVIAGYRSGVPQRLTNNMVTGYAESTAGGAATFTKYWIANSCYDPTGNLGNVQPTGFDQMMALYKRYKVTSGKLTVTFTNLNATDPVFVALLLSSQSTAPTLTVPALMGQNKVTYAVLGPSGKDKSYATLSIKFNVNEMADYEALTDSYYAGQSTANPSKPLYIHQAHVSLGTASNQTVQIVGRMFQRTDFYERIFVDDA